MPYEYEIRAVVEMGLTAEIGIRAPSKWEAAAGTGFGGAWQEIGEVEMFPLADNVHKLRLCPTV